MITLIILAAHLAGFECEEGLLPTCMLTICGDIGSYFIINSILIIAGV